jgi:putative Flp pilus-assembly TadE/G-like protein/von Willebrand factor type A domain-containing protein
MAPSLRSSAARRSLPAVPRTPRARSSSQLGQTLPLVVVFMFTILIFAGLVIDLGNAYRVQRALQASADAAAAGGAGELTMNYPANVGDATSAAVRYGSQSGGVNPIPGVPASDVSESVKVDCQAQAGYNCTLGQPNTVTVDETARVPTYLLKLLGFDTIQLKAHAQACSPCGGLPLDVMIVLDRTESMNASSKMPHAKAGIMAFLSTMDPTVDNVGLAVLPPAPSSGAACTNVGSYFGGTPTGTYSLSGAAYTVVPLSNSYATTTGNLVASSPLVSTVNCVQPGGNTAYAEAIDAAYQELQADGRPDAQKAIVILSDGAANVGPSFLPGSSPYLTNPCGQGATSAGVAKAAGVLVYSIAYTADGDDCYASPGAVVSGRPVAGFRSQKESPDPGAEQALENIATDPSYFYDLPDPTSLTGIFQRIAADLAGGSSRLVQ